MPYNIGTVSLTYPPIIVDRHKWGGNQTVHHVSINNTGIATRYIGNAPITMPPFVIARIAVISESDLEELDAMINEGGRTTANLGGNYDGLTVVIGGRQTHRFHAFNGNYVEPDEMAAGASATLTQERVDVFLVIIDN